MPRFYLDYNATTPLDARVRAAMEPYFGGSVLGNPSSLHAEGRRARAAVDLARDTVAAWVGAKPSEIIFTSGGTESNNLALQGLALAHAERGRHLITAQTEHHAVLHAFQKLEKRDGFAVTYLPVDRWGRMDPADFRAAIRPETTLISLMSANNETGVLSPLREIAAIADEHKILLHSDFVQSAGKVPVALRDFPAITALSFAAHKFHGPVGAGVLWLRGGVPLARLMEGGAHENERRPGTENVAAIAGLAEAVRLFGAGYDATETARQFRWTETLWRELAALGGVRRNGHPELRLANTLNVSFQGVQGEDVLMALDLAGLAVSSGSACLVGSVMPSHVLAAMRVLPEEASATVRFSIGARTEDADLPEIAACVRRVIAHQRNVRGWTPTPSLSEDTRLGDLP